MTASVLFEKLVLHAPHLTGQYASAALPAFVYGTAWKKGATSDLVYQALCNGFTAVDTAAQPKHYREDLVAEGISRAIKDRKVKRSELYIQTKFTSVAGQNPDDMPYDSKSPLQEQVNTSVISSLKNFDFGDVVPEGEDAQYIDTLVLHSPMPTLNETLEVWETLEQYVPGEIKNLGISNCNLFTLMDLYERARIKPSVVQNRFYPGTKFDIGVRQFCKEKRIVYQSFWTLSANPDLVWSTEVGTLADKLGISPQAALYGLVLGLGNVSILNGTKSVKHMSEDWQAAGKIREYALSHPEEWASTMTLFRKLIGQPKP
jgi:diketogulonate reductase-like aldo/keto reductase